MLYTGSTNGGNVRLFWDPRTEKSISVVSYEDGIVTLGETSLGIFEYVSIILRCFEEKSGFAKELKTSYCMEECIVIKEIKFEFEGIWLSITSQDNNVSKIVRHWKAAYEKVEADAYEKALRNDITEIVSKEKISFKNEEAKKIFEEWVKDYTYEGRVHSVVQFVERWAKYMQYLMREKGESFSSMATRTYKECKSPESQKEQSALFDLDICYILSETWEYGDEFARWFYRSKRI